MFYRDQVSSLMKSKRYNNNSNNSNSNNSNPTHLDMLTLDKWASVTGILCQTIVSNFFNL